MGNSNFKKRTYCGTTRLGKLIGFTSVEPGTKEYSPPRLLSRGELGDGSRKTGRMMRSEVLLLSEPDGRKASRGAQLSRQTTVTECGATSWGR